MLTLALPSAPAAQLKGKSLSGEKYQAELALENGKPIKGKVTFKKGQKALFKAYDGTEVAIRVRPICAHGANAEVESCWPNLAVELDDLTMRSGNLKILGKAK